MQTRFAKESISWTMRARWLPALLGLLCLLGSWSLAQAYEVNKDSKGRTLKWKTMPITWYLNPGGFTKIPASELQAAFTRAFQKWQAIKCANATFLFRGITTKYQDQRDKLNVISFPANFASKYGASLLFSTRYGFDNNGNFTDIDIELNPAIDWTTNPSGGGQDLDSVAMVVAGHIMGLSTSQVQNATMYGTFLAGDISKRSLHPDDIAGACALYAAGGPQCSTDQDCGSVDLVCQGGRCALAKNTQAQANICKPCKASNDCGSGLACDLINNTTYCLQLCSPDGLCPTGYSCNGGGINAQCLPTNGLCAAASCQSDADCGGFVCKNGKCQPECQADSDCPAAKPQCQGGKCAAKGACSRDLDCPVGQVCKNQQCVPAGDPCTQNSDCKQAGEKCVNGRCQLVTACQSDNDCPANQVCKDSYCQPGPSQCQDGQTQACQCGNQSGTQTCSGGQWGTCQCGSNTVCKAGSTQACTCQGGQSGTQTCASDGSKWEACQCGSSTVCTPGGTQPCDCSGGTKGTQVCAIDGSKWEACQCGGGCIDGQTQPCTCTNGQTGSQKCANAIWEACICSSQQNCVPGATQKCVCTDGKDGAQSCASDGSRWETCQCTGGTTPGPETGNQPDGGGTTTGKCESHGQCPASQICVRGLCTSQQPGGTGCSCDANIPHSHNLLWLLLALFGASLLLRLRGNNPLR